MTPPRFAPTNWNSGRVKWTNNPPICRVVGDLHYRVTFPSGIYYAVVRQASTKRRSWWAFKILDNTLATEVEEVV